MYNKIVLREKPDISSTTNILNLVEGSSQKLYQNLKKTKDILNLLGFSLEVKEDEVVIKEENDDNIKSMTICLQTDRLILLSNTSKGILEIDFKLDSELVNINIKSNEDLDIQISDDTTSIKLSNKKILGTNDVNVYLKCSPKILEYGIKPSHSRLDMQLQKLNVFKKTKKQIDGLNIVYMLLAESIPEIISYIENKYYNFEKVLEKNNTIKEKKYI